MKYNPEKYYDDIKKNLNKPNILGKDINFIKNSEFYHNILNDYDFKFEHYQNRFLKDTYTRKKVLKRDENTCQSCNKIFDESNLEAHHIIPKARDGDDKMINLVTLCIRCHDNEKWYGHRRAFKK